MTINELCKMAFARATEAGWWDEGFRKKPLECHMLIVSEVAEASEEVRKQSPYFYAEVKQFSQENKKLELMPLDPITYETADGKPEGEAVELADALIRICDYAGSKGWDMEAIIKAKMDYNLTRGKRHGGKLC